MKAPRAHLQGLAVLVVDDEDDIRLGLRRLLEGTGAEILEAADGVEALEILERREVDLLLTDLNMPRMGGAELLAEALRRDPGLAAVILTGYGTVQTAVACLEAGARHFLTKPFDNEEILGLVGRLGGGLLARRRARDPRGSRLLAEDPRMLRVLELVDRVAPSPLPVLLTGESGTGKELVAREIHRRSLWPERPFVAVNCGALSETLLESELFGHVRGAFTGAHRDHPGVFEQAAGGTVFLDEAASMSPALQGKLLRVLQEKVVRPVGGLEDRKVDFRLVAATNQDLEDLSRAGRFREDLYYRLAGVRIRIPPLRERPEDILPLACRFLEEARETLPPGAPLPELGRAAEEALLAHPWPGNVRELQHAIQRAVVVCCGPRILPYHLGLDRRDETAAPEPGLEDYGEARRRALERFQREFVQRALERHQGNVSRAAEACGMTRAALQRILKQLGIRREDFLPAADRAGRD